jgi:hypothetical protein
MSNETNAGCPDGGACHHLCGDSSCFRVMHCGPLSAARYPDNAWPAEIKREHRTLWLAERIREALAESKIGVDYRTMRTLLGGAVVLCEMGNQPENEMFAINIVSMANQDSTGPYFAMPDVPSSRSPE